MAEGVGLGIEGVVVLALVDPHAPQDDAGVVTVLEHHLPHVLQGDPLPRLVPDVLPAGDLREHQQTDLVAAVDKMPALGVVAGADHVAAQAELQIVGLVPLHARRGGVADVGVALMPVEAPEVDPLPVEEEALGFEFRVPEPHLKGAFIRFLPAMDQGHGQRVEPGPIQIPGRHVPGGEGELVLRFRVHGKVDGKLRQGEPQAVPIIRRSVQFHPDPGRSVGVGYGEHALYMAGLGDLEPCLPVEAPVAQVVDEKAEGGLVQTFPGVQTHGQPVLPAVFKARQQEALGHVPAVSVVIGRHRLAVQKHLGVVGSPVQNEPHLLARPGGVGIDGPGIPADGLVHLLLGALPGQELRRVREPYALSGDFAPQKFVRAGESELPIVVQGDVNGHGPRPPPRARLPGTPSSAFSR